ncbi:hypothetical protein [Pseudoalteromonas pernae]|uniref:hypothetical protein n=1 Tax=Pseudoalteromonas pernae TaxID=3118054 RepID=UPI003242E0CD
MRLTTLCIGAALFCLAPLEQAMAKPEHFTPPGHAKKMHDHHGDRDKKHKRHKKHKRDKHRHDDYYGYHYDRRHYRCDHHSHRRHDGYWRVGHRLDYDTYRHGRILRRDRHGHIIVDMHGDVFRLLENSLEIVEIISRRH